MCGLPVIIPAKACTRLYSRRLEYRGLELRAQLPWPCACRERGRVVTVAYRLGIFGWLSHMDMAIRNPGLHDLIVALDWVNANIGTFGGDPNRMLFWRIRRRG